MSRRFFIAQNEEEFLRPDKQKWASDDDPAHSKKKGKEHMDYESFKEQFIADVKDALTDQGQDMKISVSRINKLNESYEAITVTPEGSNVGVNMSLEKFYGAVEEGISYESVVDKAAETILRGFEQKPDIDVNELTDYSRMKERLAMEVVSAVANQDMLETVPHRNMEDMAVVYRFILNTEDTTASILVTNQILENMGIAPEQLHADAMENAPRIRPAEIKGMSEVMAEMMGIEQAEMMGIYPMDPKDEQIFVATVPDKVHGAGVLAYQDFMDQAAERAGGDFFILPSSLHEILIVPDNGKMSLKELEMMVREVNATQVAPADKLTDSVYHYDTDAKIFELGEKFVERQSHREAGEKEAGKDGKGSVVGELKAKKEEAAKAPKKETIDKSVKSRGGEAI